MEAEVSMKTNSFIDCETFDIFCQLATKWCQIAFVYGVIGNMASSNKCWCQRPFEQSQVYKLQYVVRINFIMICEYGQSLKSYPKCPLASRFTFTKVQEEKLDKTYNHSTSNPSPRRWKWQFQFGNTKMYPENYPKWQISTSFSLEWLIVLAQNFARQFRRSRPMTFQKLYSLY